MDKCVELSEGGGGVSQYGSKPTILLSRFEIIEGMRLQRKHINTLCIARVRASACRAKKWLCSRVFAKGFAPMHTKYMHYKRINHHPTSARPMSHDACGTVRTPPRMCSQNLSSWMLLGHVMSCRAGPCPAQPSRP